MNISKTEEGTQCQDISRLNRADLVCVVGARPNFMKIAPVMAAFHADGGPLRICLVHTGQHYDAEMNETFFRQLAIPQPDIDLGVGSGSHTAQTANVMLKFEQVMDVVDPSAVLVVGDVNSTLACSLVAVKRGVPVIHVEAGLRSYDRAMPEEINRVLTDQISTLLFTTEADGRQNLLREGIAAEGIHFVGNVMIDTLYRQLQNIVSPQQTFEKYSACFPAGTPAADFALLTLHRPSNVDDEAVLGRLLETIAGISARLPVVFPVHPRTRGMLQKSGLGGLLEDAPGVHTLPPLGYREMLGLMKHARFIMTDSGGIQEESTALGVPCITLRENTERPVTVTEGTNTVVGTDDGKIMQVVNDILATGGKSGRVPELWDGKAAERIRDIILAWMHDSGICSSRNVSGNPG